MDLVKYAHRMASYRRSNCLRCGRSRDEVHISKAGLCPTCGEAAQIRAAAEMRQGHGEAYERWLAGLRNPRSPVGRPITPYPPDA